MYMFRAYLRAHVECSPVRKEYNQPCKSEEDSEEDRYERMREVGVENENAEDFKQVPRSGRDKLVRKGGGGGGPVRVSYLGNEGVTPSLLWIGNGGGI